MEPFDRYRDGWKKPLCIKLPSDNCRHGYGLCLQQLTRETRCVYCGLDLTRDYHSWLLLCRDHVVPTRVARGLGIQEDFLADPINQVVACSGCNGFKNRWGGKRLPPGFEDVKPHTPWTLGEFVKLRDRVFEARSKAIGERRENEKATFAEKRWLKEYGCPARS